MGQPLTRSSDRQSLAQRLESQFLVHPVADRPANHPSGKQIQDHGQVEPALTRPHVRDIRVPFLVRALGREVLLKQVGSNRKGVVAVGGALEAALLPGLEAVLTHQPSRPTAPDGQALILEFARHSWAAIGAIRLSKGGPDMGEQHQIVALTLAGRTTSPGKVPALAHLKNLAQALDGEFRFRRIDEREPHRLPSLAKKAVAFLRMSRSWRSTSFSRRRRLSSSMPS